MTITKPKVDYHRNGVCGLGFHVVLFGWTDEDGYKHRMVATVRDEPGSITVLDVDQLALGNLDYDEITTMNNRWRGDHFESAVRAAIKDWEAAEDARLADTRRYELDGEPITLDALLAANKGDREVAKAADLPVGGVIMIGGGAAAAFEIRRVQ